MSYLGKHGSAYALVVVICGDDGLKRISWDLLNVVVIIILHNYYNDVTTC